MKQVKYQQKKKFVQTEKGLEKKHYRIIVGLLIFQVAYYCFVTPTTIGRDIQYSIYIFWIPTIFGMLALGIYRRQFLINRFTTNKGFVLWTFMIFFYLVQGLIFSYLSLGQVAKMSWDYCDYTIRQKNTEETLNCHITKISTGRHPSIDFTFNDRDERLSCRYQEVKEFRDKNVIDLKLKITVTKGLWNYYTVNDWHVVEK